MVRVLITAFEPYGPWKENSSWLTLVELTRELPAVPEITTRLYPVEFQEMRRRLEQDMAGDYQYAVHLGQMPGSGGIVLEAIGVNVGGSPDQDAEAYETLVDDGAVAYRCSLPLADWVARLRECNIPATVSYHAGLYLCNATMYLSHYVAEKRGYATQSVFVHLPLCPSQVAGRNLDLASLPTSVKAEALRILLSQLAVRTPVR